MPTQYIDETGMITITEHCFVTGKNFFPNTQYNYIRKIKVTPSCGCSEIYYYVVKCDDGMEYNIHEQSCVVSTVPIKCEDQNFMNKYNTELLHDQNQDYTELHNRNNADAIRNSANNIIM